MKTCVSFRTDPLIFTEPQRSNESLKITNFRANAMEPFFQIFLASQIQCQNRVI